MGKKLAGLIIVLLSLFAPVSGKAEEPHWPSAAADAAADAEPYLTADDMNALMSASPLDGESQAKPAQQGPSEYYHLEVYNRSRSPKAILKILKPEALLYELNHEDNGYAILLYKTLGAEDRVFTVPHGAFLMVGISSRIKTTIVEAIQSKMFQRYVMRPDIIASLLWALGL